MNDKELHTEIVPKDIQDAEKLKAAILRYFTKMTFPEIHEIMTEYVERYGVTWKQSEK